MNILQYNFVTETVGGESYQYQPLGKYIVRAVGVCGGRPTFKYTRIEITGAIERLAAGETISDIITGYRGRVSHEAVIEAINYVTFSTRLQRMTKLANDLAPIRLFRHSL